MQDVKLILKELDVLELQRKFWLKISGFVAIIILIIIYRWDYFTDNKLEWLIISAGLILSVIWWYWTMVLIKKLLIFKQNETKIIDEVIDSLHDIKKNILVKDQ